MRRIRDFSPARLNAFLLVMYLSVVVMLSINHAYGDRCSCPPTLGEDGSKRINEPRQRAVLLWNGQEEILFLSTDLSAPYSSPMGEVLALPGEPQVALGSLDVFAHLVELPGATHLSRDWLPSEPYGTMASSFLVGSWNDPLFRPAIASKCFSELDSYQAKGMPWVVVNNINIRTYTQSFPPIEYRFSSRAAFYPLAISAADSGMTQIDLIVITKNGLLSLPRLEYPITIQSRFLLSSHDLAALSPAWAAFFQRSTLTASAPVAAAISVTVEHIRIQGDISRMRTDFLAY